MRSPASSHQQRHGVSPVKPDDQRGAPPVHRAVAVQRSPMLLSRPAVVSLQQAAGNRAVSSLRGRGQRGAVVPVQRDIENETFAEGVAEADVANARAFFKAFDKAVDRAYRFAVSVPSLGALVALNNHTKLWGRSWAEFVSGGRPKLMAAAFGYVIESLVSEDTEYRPAPPAGCSVFTQLTRGGTRPDLVLRLKKGPLDIAWLDLTASGSVDHIYDKDGWSSKVGIFAEVTYPSLDPGTLALMKQNKDNQGHLTKEEFDRRREAARAAYLIHKRHWTEMGRQKYSVSRHKPALDRIGALLIQLDPGRKRPVIKEVLEKDFDVEVDEKMIPSILRAMGVSPSSWGFDTGFSESESAGEAWLVDNDTSMPAPEDERPRGGGKIRTQRSNRDEPYPTSGRLGPRRRALERK